MSNLIPAWVDGVLTPVDKIEAHKRGLKHPAISVFVMDGERVLIQQRALSKYHTPGLWANTCCTHPHWQEAALDCATRRLDEELGITGLVPEHRDQVEYRADVGGGLTEHELVDIFVAQAREPELPVTMNPEEVMAIRWIALGDLEKEVAKTPKAFTPWLEIYLRKFSKRIFGGKDAA